MALTPWHLQAPHLDQKAATRPDQPVEGSFERMLDLTRAPKRRNKIRRALLASKSPLSRRREARHLWSRPALAFKVGRIEATEDVQSTLHQELMVPWKRDRPRAGVVTFAAFTCQQLGAAKNRIEENQRVREPDVTADPLRNRLFLASVTMPSVALSNQERVVLSSDRR